MTARHIRSLPHPQLLDILSEEAFEKIQEATLRVLERTGIQVRSERLLKELETAGAVVDLEAGRARFPRVVVEEALARVPHEPLVLASREPGLDLTLDGGRGFLAVDGCAAEVIDLESGERRPSAKRDVGELSRIADALPQIGFLWQPCSSRDVPVHTEPLHNLDAQLRNAGKHIMLMTAVTGDQARAAVEMAAIADGGVSLRERPILSAFQCSISPLTYDGGPLEAATVFAEAGVPSGFMVMPIVCATAPATASGALVVSNAEVLAGVVALQLLVPGAKTFYGSCATCMDLRSGAATCGGPEDLLFQMASSQLARRYGLASAIGTFATGAKTSDWQAGTENGLSGLSSSLAGADMLCGAGLLYGARVYSAQQLLLDAELFDLLAKMAEGFGTSEEELAAEVIDAVGPGGHFLAEKHTRDHMRELWRSSLLSRESWEEWEGLGRPEPRDRARERARELRETHKPFPLPDGADEAIVRVIEEMER